MDSTLLNVTAVSPRSDVDEGNTSSDMVYFGPVQSPEKKLAHDIARRRTLSPGPGSTTRRSHRLLPPSSHTPQLRLRNDSNKMQESGLESGVQTPSTQPDTPDYLNGDDVEPSSVLAAKIMCAHDNPSPPPSSKSLPALLAVPLLDADESPIRGVGSQIEAVELYSPERPHRPTAEGHIVPTVVLHRASPPNLGMKDYPFIIGADGPSSLPSPTTSNIVSKPLQERPTDDVVANPFLVQFPASDTSDQMNEASLVDSPGSPRRSVRISLIRERSQSPSPPKAQAMEDSGAHDSNVPQSNHVDAVSNYLTLQHGSDRPADTAPARRSPRRSTTPTPAVPSSSTESTAAPSVHLRSLRQSMTPTPFAPEGTSLAPQETPRPSSPRRSPAVLTTPLSESPAKTRVKQWKGKARAISPADGTVSGSQSETADKSENCCGGSPVEGSEQRKKKQNVKTEEQLRRELGSLSPNSSTVLTQLFSSPARSPRPLPADVDLLGMAVSPDRPRVVRETSPKPVRTSPNKAGALVDPNRTPARRIPIAQAIRQGSASPQKGTALNDARTPVFSRAPLEDPNRTPARRVPMAQASPIMSPSRSARSMSPERFTSKHYERLGVHAGNGIFELGNARTRSAEPDVDGKSPSRSRPNSPAKSSTAPISQLPFPILASNDKGAAEPSKADGASGSLPSPQKAAVGRPTASSSLKQPSSISRIPRMGTKPYARPAKQIPAAASKNDSGTTASKPFRIVGNGKDGGSITVPPGRSTSMSAATASSTLKRKRGTEPSVETAEKPRATTIREVVPGILHPKYAPKAIPAPPTIQPPPSDLSPAKIPNLVNMRKVEVRQEPPASVIPAAEDAASSNIAEPHTPRFEQNHQGAKENTPPSSPTQVHRGPPELTFINHDPPTSPSPSEVDPTSSVLRRTTRSRKTALSGSDVFGPPSGRGAQSRRKTQARPAEPMFLGMSAIALKALTNSNTQRNQEYLVARLEREIVRRQGVRPESPGLKMRTIAQKEQEEQGIRREERAQRRARRSDEGALSDSDGLDPLSDRGDLDTSSEHIAVPFSKHRRGAGEEEDYESPAHLDRVARRLNFDGAEDMVARKRVKWDKGLFSEVFLDEIEPRTRHREPDDFSTRPCLATAAKALPLDDLGNLASATTPLDGLPSENVVVKKILYDGDPEPTPPVVKVTRSRRKSRT